MLNRLSFELAERQRCVDFPVTHRSRILTPPYTVWT
jgi:hypothetical protein